MGKIVSIVMYVLWIGTIITVLAATFTSFKFVDLNCLAGILLVVASINSYFVSTGKRPQ